MSASKKMIPAHVRVAVAHRYGYSHGDEGPAACHFCGAEGGVKVWPLRERQTVGWASFIDLELDHLVPESVGGPTTAENIVLSCPRCNRSRCNRPASYLTERLVRLRDGR